MRTVLTRERIILAALDLIDERGIDGLSMRRLGQRLGVDPMAIYHHLPTKDAVLDGVVERLWHDLRLPDIDMSHWQSGLHRAFIAVRQHLLAHPRAAILLGSRPSATAGMLAMIDELLGHLHRAGLAQAEAMPLLDCLTAFTLGKVLPEVNGLQRTVDETIAPALQAITPASHPHLLRAMSEGYDFDPQTQFERGLRALIDGWPAGSGRSQ